MIQGLCSTISKSFRLEGTIKKFLHALALSKPWQRFLISFVLGALSALAFAPLFVFPALLLSFGSVLFLLDYEIGKKSSYLRIFWLGWWFGLGHFIVGLYWIANALTMSLPSYWLSVPVGLLGIPVCLAAFSGSAFVLTALWPYDGLSRKLAFCSIWVGMEWLRGHYFLTGFPWNLVGYVWAFSSEMTQITSLVGAYGLSLLTLLMVVSLAYFMGKRPMERNIAFGICLMIGLSWIWGKHRLTHQNSLTTSSFAIRLIQPNFPPAFPGNHQKNEENFQKLLKMTTQKSSLPLKAIIWPESAVSYFLEIDFSSRKLMEKT